jgi:phosphatidylserine/phosphatidylglycerophosphate/cardiolipin synthase-like enzyme
VRLIYDATPGSGITEENEAAIDAANIRSLCTPRTNAKIMHNKYFVLTRKGKPVAVWTGSTNLSDNAIYGQLNVGHVIENAAIAKEFHEYWTELAGDPDLASIRGWAEETNEIPTVDGHEPLVGAISPHRGTHLFNRFKEFGESVHKGLFMTFPFGIVKDFRPVYDHNDNILRYALLDKYVNGGTQVTRDAAIRDTKRIRALPNVGMALGSRIFLDNMEGWVKEAEGIGKFVNWVHAKFMLVDPLSDNPTTITGSANWSMPSTNENDENMIVIRGDKRVADIYFTEFMRIFTHHRFRESLQIYYDKYHTTVGWKPQDLKEKTDEWLPIHYKTGSEYPLRRAYFSGAK